MELCQKCFKKKVNRESEYYKSSPESFCSCWKEYEKCQPSKKKAREFWVKHFITTMNDRILQEGYFAHESEIPDSIHVREILPGEE